MYRELPGRHRFKTVLCSDTPKATAQRGVVLILRSKSKMQLFDYN